jgi:hypothetical protein
MNPTTITAIHIYHPDQLNKVLRKLRPALFASQNLWLSSSNPSLLSAAEHLVKPLGLPVRTFPVSNAWNDWSGFLAFLSAAEPNMRLIIANDSITTRRILGNRSISAFVQTSLDQTHALVGELELAAESVVLQGESSACWISTYLFSLSGIEVDAAQLETIVRADVAHIFDTPEHFFLRYLKQRRPSLVSHPDVLQAKLGAMCFERQLTHIAMTQGANIVHAYAGNWLRKLERLMERIHDA